MRDRNIRQLVPATEAVSGITSTSTAETPPDAAPPSSNKLWDKAPKHSDWGYTVQALGSTSGKLRSKAEVFTAPGRAANGFGRGTVIHIRKGVLNSAKGRNRDDIQNIRTRQREFCLSASKARRARHGKFDLSKPERHKLTEKTSQLHGDTLNKLDALIQIAKATAQRKRSFYTPDRSVSVQNLFRSIRQDHEEFFGPFIDGTAGDEDNAHAVARKLDELVELCDRLSEKEVSLLLALLKVERATVIKLADCMISGRNSDAATIDQALDEILKASEELCVRTYGGAAFHAFDTLEKINGGFDYVMKGLSDPDHKLSEARGFNNTSLNDYVEGIMNFGPGDSTQLGANWDRGLGIDLLWLAAPASAVVMGLQRLLKVGAYFGGSPRMVADEAYAYRLTFEGGSDALKVKLSRKGGGNLSATINAWGGGGTFSAMAAELTAGVRLKHSQGNEAELAITIKKDAPNLRENLTKILSGKVENLEEFLKMSSESENYHKIFSGQNLNMYVGGEFHGSLFKAFGRGAAVQNFPTPAAASIEATLFDRLQERRKAYGKAGVKQLARSRKLIHVFKDRKYKVVIGASDPSRLRQDIIYDAGAFFGPAINFPLRYAVEYTPPSRTWWNILGWRNSHHSICDNFTHHFDEKGDLNKITWDLTMRRDGLVLDHPAIEAMMGNMSAQEATNARAALVDAVSLTTPNNRFKINELISELRRILPDFTSRLDDLTRFTKFTSSQDVKIFQSDLKKLRRDMPLDNPSADFAIKALEQLKELSDRKDTQRWPARESGRDIMIKMESTQEFTNKVRMAKADDAIDQTVKAASAPGSGKLTDISFNETRTAQATFLWPILLTFSSEATKVDTKKRSWSAKTGEWNVPLDGVPDTSTVDREVARRPAAATLSHAKTTAASDVRENTAATAPPKEKRLIEKHAVNPPNAPVATPGEVPRSPGFAATLRWLFGSFWQVVSRIFRTFRQATAP